SFKTGLLNLIDRSKTDDVVIIWYSREHHLKLFFGNLIKEFQALKTVTILSVDQRNEQYFAEQFYLNPRLTYSQTAKMFSASSGDMVDYQERHYMGLSMYLIFAPRS